MSHYPVFSCRKEIDLKAIFARRSSEKLRQLTNAVTAHRDSAMSEVMPISLMHGSR